MAAMNLKERILAALTERGPMTDSDLALRLDARHRSVNQAARQLVAEGRIARGDREGRLINAVVASAANPQTLVVPAGASVERPMVKTPPLPPPGCVALVSCVKTKLDHPAPASDLYTSALFKRQKEWALARCNTWFILSAKHGLLRPTELIAPYDLTLKTQSRAERRAWSGRVLDQLTTELNVLSGRHFEIYAGKDYSDFGLVEGLRQAGATVFLPWDGLGLGSRIGRDEYASSG
jgi:hypothetical protein